MKNYSFQVRWSDEDLGYVATCPEFPGVSGIGESPDGAVRQAEAALQLAVETFEEEGWSLPAPSVLERQHSGQLRVRMPRSLHSALVSVADNEDVSLNTLVVSYLSAGIGAGVAVSKIYSKYEHSLRYVSKILDQSRCSPYASSCSSPDWDPNAVLAKMPTNIADLQLRGTIRRTPPRPGDRLTTTIKGLETLTR